MSYYTKTTIMRGIASYRAAFDRMLERCPNVDFYGSGNPITGVMSGSIEIRYSGNKYIEDLDEITAHHIDDLFEYGRPKLVQKGWWLWNSDFFRVYGRMEEAYSFYTMKEMFISEDGKRTRPKVEECPQKLILHVEIAKFGLNSFLTNDPRIRSAVRGAKKELIEKYLLAVEKAEKVVADWKSAIESIKIPA